MKLSPKCRRIVVRPEAQVEKTASGILIPEAAQDPQIIGVITEVASDCEYVSVGDKIIYPKNCGTPVSVTGEPLLVMREIDVLCVITSKPDNKQYVTNSTANIFDA